MQQFRHFPRRGRLRKPGHGRQHQRMTNRSNLLIGHPRCERKLQRLVVRQWLRRWPFAGGQWPSAERLEVRHAGVTPPLRFVVLDLQERSNVPMPLRIDRSRRPAQVSCIDRTWRTPRE